MWEQLELNKIKQLKVEELKKIAQMYGINTNQKKNDILEELNKFI